MLLWLFLLTFTVAICAFLIRPFVIEGRSAVDAATTASQMTRDQLQEIDRELAEGLIDAAQADAARLDVKRRLLRRLPDQTQNRRILALVERKFVAGVLAGGVGLGSIVLYGVNGSPEIESASRQAGVRSEATAGMPVPQHVVPGPGPVAPGTAKALASVEDLIQGLVARLAKTPDDANGWRMLGWSYAGIGQFQEAATAYSRAIALQPTIGTLRTARGEAFVRAADGKVSAEARADFEAALLVGRQGRSGPLWLRSRAGTVGRQNRSSRCLGPGTR